MRTSPRPARSRVESASADLRSDSAHERTGSLALIVFLFTNHANLLDSIVRDRDRLSAEPVVRNPPEDGFVGGQERLGEEVQLLGVEYSRLRDPADEMTNPTSPPSVCQSSRAVAAEVAGSFSS